MVKNVCNAVFLILLTLSLTACVKVDNTRRDNGGRGNKRKLPALDRKINLSKKNEVLLKSWPNRADNKKKVKVCLINKTAKGKWKGMYYKPGKPPAKFQTKGKNSSSCAHYSQGKKTFYFWRSGFLGKKKLVNTFEIDLSGYKGWQVNFEWVKDK